MNTLSATAIAVMSLAIAGCKDSPTDPPVTPASVGDGWFAVSPESQRLDSRILNQGFAEAEQAGFVDALLVTRNGYIVGERYFNGYDSSRTHNVMSVSKSFLSAVTGLVFREGFLDRLDQRVLPFFPEYVGPKTDSLKHRITIRHLLTMRMGIQDEESNYSELYNSANWIQATIEYPFIAAPGAEFHYNTFGTHLLSGVITKATATTTYAFARAHLLDPMGITVDAWQQDPQGYYFGGNSMHFTPREMARFGLLYLHGGKQGDAQIVPADWVKFTITPSTDWQGSTWGSMTEINYAYLWWLGTLNEHEAFMAIGHGGQYVVCVPSLNMVVVSTSNNNVNWDVADAQEQAVLTIISTYVLGAVRE